MEFYAAVDDMTFLPSLHQFVLPTDVSIGVVLPAINAPAFVSKPIFSSDACAFIQLRAEDNIIAGSAGSTFVLTVTATLPSSRSVHGRRPSLGFCRARGGRAQRYLRKSLGVRTMQDNFSRANVSEDWEKDRLLTNVYAADAGLVSPFLLLDSMALCADCHQRYGCVRLDS